MGAAGASWKPDICIKNDTGKTFPFWFQCACLFIYYYLPGVKTRSAKVKHTISQTQTRINITAVLFDAKLKPLKCKLCFIRGCCKCYAPFDSFLCIILVPAKEEK